MVMVLRWERWIIVILLVIIRYQMSLAGSTNEGSSTKGIFKGLNYGMVGDNLPPPAKVIDFLINDLNYSSPNIRLFEPKIEVLDALKGSKLIVSIGIRNEDVVSISSSQEAAEDWMKKYIYPYSQNPFTTGVIFLEIVAGNEMIPGTDAQSVLPAMQNIQASLDAANITSIFVTTCVPMTVLGTSFPPSAGEFSTGVADIMSGVTSFIYGKGGQLLVNVYPYFAFISDPAHISLDYALFNPAAPVVVDGNLTYHNLFDAMVDACHAAVARVLGKEVAITVSETGWPSAGNDPYTSIDNAKTYNNNLLDHVVNSGTPRRPETRLQIYVFAMFNEDLKPGPVEQSWGNFYPDLTEVYPLWRGR